MKMSHVLAAALFALVGAAVQAQTLTGAKMEPAEAKVGEKVTLTASFELNAQNATNCRVQVNFGDGTPLEAFKINQMKDVPLVATHVYTKPGTYTVAVEPRTKLPMLKCMGGDHSTTVKVVAPVAPVAAAASGATPAPSCPDGWALDKKSVNKKTGAYTCTAKVGTAAPAGKLACPGTLGYFENTKKGQLGCRP